MSSPTVVMLQFIGLVTFSTQLSDDGHLIAFTPIITHAAAMSSARSATDLPGGDAIGSQTSAEVEEHATIIAFKACNYVSTDGWPVQALERVPGYLYVSLNGVRVTFTGSRSRTRSAVLTAKKTGANPTGGERRALQLPG